MFSFSFLSVSFRSAHSASVAACRLLQCASCACMRSMRRERFAIVAAASASFAVSSLNDSDLEPVSSTYSSCASRSAFSSWSMDDSSVSRSALYSSPFLFLISSRAVSKSFCARAFDSVCDRVMASMSSSISSRLAACDASMPSRSFWNSRVNDRRLRRNSSSRWRTRRCWRLARASNCAVCERREARCCSSAMSSSRASRSISASFRSQR
mmetsp:Transcript_6543/g.26629  ORF Transcript_6543/g.26629 Transcript_6543/m.26629 type:complete len:211 (+) Transcript_6543:3802-4434(+)